MPMLVESSVRDDSESREHQDEPFTSCDDVEDAFDVFRLWPSRRIGTSVVVSVCGRPLDRLTVLSEFDERLDDTALIGNEELS